MEDEHDNNISYAAVYHGGFGDTRMGEADHEGGTHEGVDEEDAGDCQSDKLGQMLHNE